jgi:hypothetical protein
MSRGYERTRTVASNPIALKEKQVTEKPVENESYLGKKSDSNSIVSFEDKHREAKVETAAGYTADGRKLFDMSNNKVGEVRFTPEQMKMLRESKDAILTHNHPSSRPFSNSDVMFLLQGGLLEIRAVGKYFTYSLSDPTGEFRKKFTLDNYIPNKNLLESDSGLFDIYQRTTPNYERVAKDAASEFLNKHPDASLEELEVAGQRATMHIDFEGFAKRNGLVYKRVPTGA